MSLFEFIFNLVSEYPVLVIGAVLAVGYIILSFHKIGPTEVGLVTKRFSFAKLKKDNLVAFRGEAGYQAKLLMPGLRWKAFPIYSVGKYPWVQVPAGEIGVVISQVGQPLPIGAKSAIYKKEFANFSDLRNFFELGGQKGVQRPVLPPGSLVPIHPVGFLVITCSRVYGVPVSPELRAKIGLQHDPLLYGAYALNPGRTSSMVRSSVPAIAAFGRSPCARVSIRSTHVVTSRKSCRPPF